MENNKLQTVFQEIKHFEEKELFLLTGYISGVINCRTALDSTRQDGEKAGDQNEKHATK